MNEEGLVPLILNGRIHDAVQLARRYSVEWVDEQLDYDTLDDNAEVASEFLQAWCAALPPLARLQAADWAAGQFVNPMVDLEHAYRIGTQLVLEAQAATTAYLSQSFRETWALADGPDAELDPSVVERLVGYADVLETMNFEPVWIPESEAAD